MYSCKINKLMYLNEKMFLMKNGKVNKVDSLHLSEKNLENLKSQNLFFL